MSTFIKEMAGGWAILRQGMTRRGRLGSQPLNWLLGGIALLLPLMIVLPDAGRWRQALSFGAGIPLFVLALLWWGYIHGTVVAQNRSIARRIVPGLRRRSLQATFSLWAGLTLFFGALFSLQFGASLTPVAVVALALSTVGICTLESAASLGLMVVFFLITGVGIGSGPARPRAEVLQQLQSGIVLLAVLVTALWIWMEGRLLDRTAPFPFSLPVGNKQAEGRLGFENTLVGKRDVTCGDGEGVLTTSAGNILMLNRVPSLSVRSLVVGLTTISLFCAAAIKQPALIWFGVIAFQITYAWMLRARIMARAREQALMRLAPRAPSAGALNRVLGAALLARYMVAWACFTVAGAITIYLMTRSAGSMVTAVLMFCLTLPAAAIFLRDYSSNRATPVRSVLLVVWLALLVGVPYYAAGQALGLQAGLLAMALAGSGAVIAVALQRMAAAPVAFPAGRRS